MKTNTRSKASIRKSSRTKPSETPFQGSVRRAMFAAAREARKVARMHGTPIVVMEGNKIVNKWP